MVGYMLRLRGERCCNLRLRRGSRALLLCRLAPLLLMVSLSEARNEIVYHCVRIIPEDRSAGFMRPDFLDGPVVDAEALAQLVSGEAAADGAV